MVPKVFISNITLNEFPTVWGCIKVKRLYVMECRAHSSRGSLARGTGYMPHHPLCFRWVSTSLLVKVIYLMLASDGSLNSINLPGSGQEWGATSSRKCFYKCRTDFSQEKRLIDLGKQQQQQLWNQIFLYSGKCNHKSKYFLPMWLFSPPRSYTHHYLIVQYYKTTGSFDLFEDLTAYKAL